MLILRQYAYRGTDLVVIPQPDGTVACIPAWMTHELAAQHKVSIGPNLSLDVLRALRAEAKSRRRRGLWICRFAWTTQTRCPHQQRQKQQEAA